jgi:galactokinase/mevalonate kinase-like predicted kinase
MRQYPEAAAAINAQVRIDKAHNDHVCKTYNHREAGLRMRSSDASTTRQEINAGRLSNLWPTIARRWAQSTTTARGDTVNRIENQIQIAKDRGARIIRVKATDQRGWVLQVQDQYTDTWAVRIAGARGQDAYQEFKDNEIIFES